MHSQQFKAEHHMTQPMKLSSLRKGPQSGGPIVASSFLCPSTCRDLEGNSRFKVLLVQIDINKFLAKKLLELARILNIAIALKSL